jgi:hypothetical protein
VKKEEASGPLFFARNAVTTALYFAEQEQYQQYDQYGADNTGRAVAPVSGVRENWQPAHQQQDQDDQKYQGHDYFLIDYCQ